MTDAPLDPAARAFLDRLASGKRLPTSALPVEEARRQFAQLQKRAGGPPPAGVSAKDLTIPGSDAPRPARLYQPETPHADRPLLLWLHGGGWVLGDLDTHDVPCRWIAKGYGGPVLSLDYRRAPESPFPAALHDAEAAYAWALEKHGAVAVGGDSAGGNLAGALCLLLRDHGQPAPVHQALLYPSLDATLSSESHREHAEGKFLEQEDVLWFLDQYATGQGASVLDPLVSPLQTESMKDLPPATVMIAGHDPLADDGRRWVKRLVADGIPAGWWNIPD